MQPSFLGILFSTLLILIFSHVFSYLYPHYFSHLFHNASVHPLSYPLSFKFLLLCFSPFYFSTLLFPTCMSLHFFLHPLDPIFYPFFHPLILSTTLSISSRFFSFCPPPFPPIFLPISSHTLFFHTVPLFSCSPFSSICSIIFFLPFSTLNFLSSLFFLSFIRVFKMPLRIHYCMSTMAPCVHSICTTL